jgi:hypothetical protein
VAIDLPTLRDWGKTANIDRRGDIAMGTEATLTSPHHLKLYEPNPYKLYGEAPDPPSTPNQWFAQRYDDQVAIYGSPFLELVDSVQVLPVTINIDFFASILGEGCAVWAVDGRWALKQAMKILRVVEGKEEPAKRLLLPTEEFHEEDYIKLLFEEPFVKVAFPLNPFRLNERLRAQRGTFMAPGKVSNTFMENLLALDGYNKNCIKIQIPYKLRKNALQRLFDMNISRTSLFPGLDGYAQSLGIFHSSFKPDPYEQMR